MILLASQRGRLSVGGAQHYHHHACIPRSSRTSSCSSSSIKFSKVSFCTKSNKSLPQPNLPQKKPNNNINTNNTNTNNKIPSTASSGSSNSTKQGSVVVKRKPTVDEEIKDLKRRDVRHFLLLLLGAVTCKVLYDAYSNYVQNQLYERNDTNQVLWEQIGKNVLREALVSRTVRLRYGKGFSLDGPLSIVKRRQLRYYWTGNYIENTKLFFLRFRTRIWEDIGTMEVSIPVRGSTHPGTLHINAYTRDRNWILQKAWLEDDNMVIELQRRIDLDLLLNPDTDYISIEQNNNNNNNNKNIISSYF